MCSPHFCASGTTRPPTAMRCWQRQMPPSARPIPPLSAAICARSHLHHRSDHRQGLRRRDLCRGARRRPRAHLGAHRRVTSYLPEDGVVDRAGRRVPPAPICRASSLQCSHRSSPTMPARWCQAEDRRAVTVEMVLLDGRCLSAEVYRSLIRSDARLTYDEVDEVFEGRPPPRAGPLGRAAAGRPRGGRPNCSPLADGQLELEIPEPEFTFDPRARSPRSAREPAPRATA